MALLKIARDLLFAATFAAVPLAGMAEDIDLFKGGSAITGQKPNVLIVLDNSANWNRSDQGWPVGKQGESELQAISNVMGSLTGDVRVGLMAFVKGAGSDKSGGYVRFAVRDMDATNRAAIQSLLSGYKANFNDQNAGQQVATADADYGAMMMEIWRYFSGGSQYAGTASLRDYSGNGSPNVAPYTAGSLTGNAFSTSTSTTYVSPLSASSPCNKNFIIFIGNGFPSTSSTDPGTLSVTDWTTSDSTQIYNEGTKTTYLDEWARFLYKTGIKNVPCDTSVTPNICAEGTVTTYTIDVYKDHQDTEQTALLKSTASVGGGKYFAATSETAIQDALNHIFSEIQAVNSVFTSASLPVSVNTQGTYLNQIYMGVFRPDSAGQPRWMGNLKQYKFGITTDASGNDTIFLADADGNAAVNSVSGFVDPSARSYWTKSTSPDPGFWAFSPSGNGGQYDSPDGDLVEKGGAAQKLRDLGPTSRTVYTCSACTSGNTPDLFATSNATLISSLTSTSSAVTSLTRSGTTVSVTTASDLSLASPTDSVSISGASVASYNGSWTATKVDGTHFTFPVSETPVTPATGSSITVSSGTSVAQTVATGGMTWVSTNTTMGTSTIPANSVLVNLPSHGFINGQSVVMAGADVSAGMATAYAKCAGWTSTATCEYNGTFSINYIDANNFWYQPPTANLGYNQGVAVVTLDPPDTITVASGATAAITCQNNTGSNGSVTISGITRTSGSGSQTVKVQLASLPSSCTNTSSGSKFFTRSGTGNNGRITGITLSGTGYTSLNITPTITGVGTACGTTAASTTDLYVCFTLTVGSSTTYNTVTMIPASPATGTITATGIPTRQVTSITRTAGDASNVATVTVTTATNHGFGGSTSVTIAGADQSEYNGTRTTANTVGNQLSIASGSNTLTFTIYTGPTTPATGASAAKGSSIDANTLVNWVRGVDNKEDENVNASLTDCRASIHGDVLHSRPLVINYGDSVGIYAFYGSNDGTFRAVKAGQDESATSTDGKEVWSFVAPEHYSTLGRLYNNSPYIKYVGDSAPKTPRDYFFDGNIGVFQSADLATTHIFISMRRGGRFIYALDVSSPTAPKFLWKKSYTDTGMSELGYTWSEPKVIPIKKTTGVACNTADASTFTRALVFGAGYDPTSDDTNQISSAVRRPNATMGRGVFVLNAADGSLIKLLQPPANDYKGQSNSSRSYPIPSDVTVLDSDGDGCVDRIYAGDTGAKMHRFDIGDASSANWKAYTIATLGDSGDNGGSNDRKILYPPEVVLGVVGGQQVAYVMFGTGDREQPSATTIDDRFYMIRDTIVAGDAVATSTATTNAVKESQLTSVTNFNSSTTTLTSSTANATSCSKYSSTYSASTPCFFGWYLDYETGEKSVNAALTVAGTTFFGTNKPKAADPRSCSANLGEARGYAINFLTGTSSVGDRDGNGTINRTDLYSVFKGGGLPPSAVSGVVQISSSKTVRFVIGSGGTGTAGSTIEGVKTQVNPSGTRTRVFWYFKKDD